MSMKTYNIMKPIRDHFKHLALVAVLGVGLAAGGAQALTSTYELGPVDGGTSIGNGAVLPTAWIAAGTLPAGSILKSVSINARLDTFGGGDTWASDLAVYVDPGTPPPPSGSALLQVGGYDAIGGPVTKRDWSNGGSGEIGTTCIDTKTAPADFPDTIDLSTAGLYLANGGWTTGSWSGTVTIEYEVTDPNTTKDILTFTFPTYGDATITGSWSLIQPGRGSGYPCAAKHRLPGDHRRPGLRRLGFQRSD